MKDEVNQLFDELTNRLSISLDPNDQLLRPPPVVTHGETLLSLALSLLSQCE